jgi:asparagine synthase (glutamine-hydrolysing)
MCGIYGSTIKYGEDTVQEKLNRANFRGPDHCGSEEVEGVILGHNRLAIIDLDGRSDQPFSYMHLRVVFNGELYNYIDLRGRLKVMGYHFTTSSDTEVLAAAYLAFGEDCVDQFNGMFAFVIHDIKKQVLFGARDRLGKKPLYYTHQGTKFEFASQPAQITIGQKLMPDTQAIHQFFLWGYIPEPKSAWEKIKKLKAGYTFIFSIKTGELMLRQYWSVTQTLYGEYKGAYTSAVKRLDNLLTDSVYSRLNADVNLGVFLSGGIDSSLVAAIASKKEKIKTFCIKFKGKKYDESNFALAVAKHLNTEHHTIECDYREGIAMIQNFNRYFDEPFADYSAIPSLLLNKYTKQHVTVALSGDGGDESFYGYHRYRRLLQVAAIYKFPLGLRKAVGSAMQLFGGYKQKLLGAGISQSDFKSLYVLMLGGLDFSWLNYPLQAIDVDGIEVLTDNERSLLQKMSAMDIATYLNGDINTKVDRSAMAYAVEVRSPLMDYRVVEFAQDLPDSFKYKNGVQKRILKDLLYRYVPKSYFSRPKSGFTLPLGEWFRNELKEYVLSELPISVLKDIPCIDPVKTQLYIKQHMKGEWNRTIMIWKLLVYVQWVKANNN